MKRAVFLLWFLLGGGIGLCFAHGGWQADAGKGGLVRLDFEMDGALRNFIDKDAALGEFRLIYRRGSRCHDVSDADFPVRVRQADSSLVLHWVLPEGLCLSQSFIRMDSGDVRWELQLENTGRFKLQVTDLGVRLPLGGIDNTIEARYNYCRHHSVNGDASFLYWVPYSGTGNCLLMLPVEGTSLEFASLDSWYYMHATTVADRRGDTWRLPSSSSELQPGESRHYGFRLFCCSNRDSLETAIYEGGSVCVRVVPGMVIPRGEEVLFALRSATPISRIGAEYASQTDLEPVGAFQDGFYRYRVRFDRLGENLLTVSYGNKRCYLEFFVTEPLETLIRKRSAFITSRQQHRRPDKWYDGLYSLYDMECDELLSPDYLQDLREEFMVGGSDDPSNSKPIFVSEKNVAYPDSAEIASLEYYERNFVWGKLQRTDEEYPYPYGIYGSENWFRNRSGRDGGYDAGGSGKGRMWRTFDYTTHFAVYYNLYLIARDNPQWTSYLDADGYLQRAYRTAMAFFEVPYNIEMGSQWAFHGWCDWAYKQGNFHERYLLDIVDALEENGYREAARRLRREWEKKVAYMIYEDPWPFGSEMFVDRTAFESSYYVAQYALQREMVPQEQFWYDKNRRKWYSYTAYDPAEKHRFMRSQLDANLALRGILEPGYHSLGTAWGGGSVTLDYMSQMGGVALLDYGVRFAEQPADFIRYGYNSLLSSWALMNTGDRSSDYGYWHKGVDRDGAVGWAFSYYQHSHPYMNYINVGRGPWRYDGEIDHGLAGAVHGAGCYIVDDPLFGEVCYGGRLIATERDWRVRPWDGVCRYVSIPGVGRFEFRLENDGLDPQGMEVSRDLSRLAFAVERRSPGPHDCRIRLDNLPPGRYKLLVEGAETSRFVSEPQVCLRVPVTKETTNIQIIKL